MNKKIILITIFLVIIISIIYYFSQNKSVDIDPLNCNYIINGENFNLIKGKSEIEIPNSSSKIITYYSNIETYNDFNNDKINDVAGLIMQNTGGSGTFFYLAVVLGGNKECQSIESVFLGDRVSPQSIEVEDNRIIVNYLDRALEDSMADFPSIIISRQFLVENNRLIEIIPE